MAFPLSVSELVYRCAPPTEAHRSIWFRRARLWTLSGALPTAHPQGGFHKHRGYSGKIIFLASVLFRLSDYITTDIVKTISKTLQEADNRVDSFGRTWRRAKQGRLKNPTYICFSFVRDIYPELWITFHQGGLEGLIPKDDGPAISLNLSRVLEELSAAAAEEEGA